MHGLLCDGAGWLCDGAGRPCLASSHCFFFLMCLRILGLQNQFHHISILTDTGISSNSVYVHDSLHHGN